MGLDREEAPTRADGQLPVERAADAEAAARSEAAPAGPTVAAIMRLQRSAGNHAVAELLAARSAPAPDRPALADRSPESGPQYRSPALRLRSLLRARAAGARILQRVVTTSGGDWDTDKYDLLQDRDSAGTLYPAAQGIRGVDIKLKFAPNTHVDAELIGLSQSVQSFVNNAPNLTPAAATRAIPAADAQNINTGPGETDEGTAIDMAQGFNSPMYAVQSTASTSLADTNTLASWGQHGFHFKDKTNTLRHQDATLMDTPIRGHAQKDSRQIFEVTALATKGAQAGTYYGSVRWGWRTDSKGAFTKIPLEKVTDGVPASTFLKAGEIWNKGKSSTGAANVNLPIPDVKVTTAPITLRPPVPLVDIALPVGTRVQIVTDYSTPLLAGTVKVVDGPHTGVTGDVDGAEWPNIVDERA